MKPITFEYRRRSQSETVNISIDALLIHLRARRNMSAPGDTPVPGDVTVMRRTARPVSDVVLVPQSLVRVTLRASPQA